MSPDPTRSTSLDRTEMFLLYTLIKYTTVILLSVESRGGYVYKLVGTVHGPLSSIPSGKHGTAGDDKLFIFHKK